MASPKLNTSPDSAKLLKILNSISSELDQPYIERRLKSISQKSNPLDELQDAINHITQRENDLQACIGIARVLAENNDELLIEKENIEELLKDKNIENRKLNEEISRLEEELEIAEEKFKDVNSILANSQRLVSPKKSRDDEVEIISIEKHESDMAELKEKFKNDYDNMLSNL
jgi:chromosome segregation ATPase